MRIYWEPKEVNPGIIVAKPGCNERWMIGYASWAEEDRNENPRKYTLNSMIDGLVQGPKTREELAQSLTIGNKIPVDILDNLRFNFPKRDS